METKYTISILAYTAIDDAKRCVESVLEHSRSCKLILTSNGSPELAAFFDSVQERCVPGAVTVIKNEQNEGFIGPHRKAFELCDTPYFVLLNDDTEVTPGWLVRLESPFNKYTMAALSGPKGSCCSLRDNLDGYPGPRLEYLEGSCLMCKSEIIRKHGLFSPDLVGIYCEDSDLSLRMRRLGYTIHQVDVKIPHKRSVTTKHIPGIRDIQLRNAEKVKARFGHYLKVRRMDYPILVKRSHALGDVLLTTMIVEALKRENPLCPIYVQTLSPDVFRNNPNVKRAMRTLPINDRSTLTIDLNMAYENRPGTNIAAAYAAVAGVQPASNWRPILYTNPDEQRWAQARLHSNGSLRPLACAIHTGPSWPGKTWPADQYNPVIEHLRSLGYKIILIGHAYDAAYCFQQCDLDLRGKTTLHQLAAVLKECNLFLGVDSMPLHCATAAGIPTIGLFGVTLPEFILSTSELSFAVVADRDHPFTGARHKEAGQTFVECAQNPMETITPEMVIEAINNFRWVTDIANSRNGPPTNQFGEFTDRDGRVHACRIVKSEPNGMVIVDYLKDGNVIRNAVISKADLRS